VTSEQVSRRRGCCESNYYHCHSWVNDSVCVLNRALRGYLGILCIYATGLRDPRADYESNDTRFGVRRSVVCTVVAGCGGGKRATTQVLQ